MLFLYVIIGVFIGIFLMCLVQINRENKECLHCGKGPAAYCEKCYQDLISENAKLQQRIVEIHKSTNQYMETKKTLNSLYGKYVDTDSIEKHIPRID